MTLALAVGVVLGLVATAPAVFAAEVRYNRDIRPILSANCFHCHGPDAKHREADLRLDEEEGVELAFGGGLDESEAWRRIVSTDDDRMPPPDGHHELTQDEIQLLKQWVEQGASWEGHWAFIAPTSPPIPQASDPTRVRNPIDAFILARLAREGISPSDEADQERLLRRVCLDLTGLPPSIAEIDTFLADDSEDAYEKVVDRLLASEHFGERMALAWMDAARYGDSSVFHADGPRDMWPWRDWVIRAYNGNKPFDEFTVEQLAGDLLPNATLDQKIATGFNRNNATTDEGGAIAEEFRVEYAVDRVKTTSMVWMGLSMECAQCHDHKYDPITMTDYYRFFAYFNQASDPGMQTRGGNQAPVVSALDVSAQAEAEQLESRLPSLETKLKERATAAESDFEKWLAQAAADTSDQARLPGGAVVHLPLDESLVDAIQPDRTASIQGKTLWADGRFGRAFKCDRSNFVDAGQVADFERTDTFSYGCWIKPDGDANGAPIARMNDGNSFRGFDLHCSGGQAAVHIINTWPTNAIKVTTKAKLKPNEWQHVFVTYDGSSKAAGIKIYFDGESQPWDVNEDRLSDTVRTKVPLYLGRRNPGSQFAGLIDEVRVYDRQLSDSEVAALAGSDPVGPLLALEPEDRTDAQRQQLRTHYLTSHDKAYQDISAQIRDIKRKIAGASQPISTVMVMQDVPKMRPTFVLYRGNYASPIKERAVQPGVLDILPPLPDNAPQNRLGLARWLVRPDHPLTARAAINRYWYLLFGTGLVKTLEDFGAQGEPPSHADLLDWLAVDFVESGWNVKRMIKQMVMSATYRQTSRVTPDLLQRDPENRLLARGPRFRLQGEFIRDNALAASGLLVRTIGGPGVKPYQPPGLWNEVSLSGNVRFVQDRGEKLYRRSLYIYWKRSAPAPAMTIFDAPTREKCTLRRSRTNTPLQALVTMNDVQFVEAARALAQRVMKEGGNSTEDQIVLAYRLTAGTRPSAAVLDVLKQAHADELEVFRQEPERAAKLLAIGDSKRDENLDPAIHAAMSVVASMILNLDETLTRG
jgi:mono/diheme cytochrome c family protein